MAPGWPRPLYRMVPGWLTRAVSGLATTNHMNIGNVAQSAQRLKRSQTVLWMAKTGRFSKVTDTETEAETEAEAETVAETVFVLRMSASRRMVSVATAAPAVVLGRSCYSW